VFYTALVSREGRHWLAEFPDCPGCQTFATSRQALVDAAQEALEGWLEAHLVDGQVPPEPRTRRRGATSPGSLRVEVSPPLAVAVRIRQTRARLGLTQTELARRAGVSQQQIAKLERPGENPTVATLASVARALGCFLDVEFRRAG
jgi:predicted RNase H-like HicB family nuclease/DNA-binding XRE family transcriptional regulator